MPCCAGPVRRRASGAAVSTGTWRRSWPISTRPSDKPTTRLVGSTRRSRNTRRRSRSAQRSTTCATSSAACCWRRGARSRRTSISRPSSAIGRPSSMPRQCSGSRHTWPAMGSPRAPCGRSCAPDGRKTPEPMHTEGYELAADAYRTLAKRARSRAEEAADGLDRVARAALAANDRTALASALTGLREVAPRRPLGRYVVLAALDAVDRGDTAEANALLPVAAASAVDASRADSLLYVYGMARARVRDCSTAVRVFEGVVRRQRAP